MGRHHQLLRSAAAAAFLLLPCTSSALTSAESACRDTIAESMTSYVTTAAKNVVRCHQRRSSGSRSLETDCNDVSEASNDGMLAAALSKARSEILSACDGAESVLGDYTACPAPAAAADDGGATPGIDDLDELVDCLAALSDAHVGALGKDAQGLPPSPILDPLRKCQGRLGKGTSRVVREYLRERRSCQSEADQSGDGGYDCDGADPRGRLAAATRHFADKVLPYCTFSPEVLDQLEACSNDYNGLIACAGASASTHGSDLIRSFYSLSGSVTTTTLEAPTTTLGGATTTTLPGTACGDTAPQCDGSCQHGLVCEQDGGDCKCVATGSGPCAPATIQRRIVSRYSTTVDSETALNAGWSGLAHKIDFPNNSGDTVNVTCDDNCENCDVALRPIVEHGSSPCRCNADATKPCSVINGSDPDTCGSVDPTCRCYFGAPLPTVASGNPACIAFRIRNDYGGTMNLRSGEWHDRLSVAAIVYLGLDKAAPCPTCNGDPIPNDGIRGGTCSTAGGGACDVNGSHSTFGKLSNDCLPPTASNISGVGLLVSVDLNTDTVTLPATLPCDTPVGSNCHCRTCTGNSNQSCSNDDQCAAIGAGQCTDAGGAGVRLNQCDDFECSPNGDCTIGPVDSYCDGKIYPDGRGYIPCSSNNDCSQDSAGVCTLKELRHCFPDPIVYTGTPDVYQPASVSAFCVAPTSNPAINIASGLPGPGALLLKFDNQVFCQSDPTVPYEFPSGENCTASVSTTTTTLLPLPGCAEASSPSCGGVCPSGQTCGDNAGSCECTDIPLPACGEATSPSCGGICTGTGEVCTDNGGVCDCLVVTLPQCTDAAAPTCGGVCPNGEVCSNAGSTCECGAPGLPTCGTAISPSCGGVCDINQACVDSGGTCMCMTLPVPLCNSATTPLCLGACSTGSTCGAVGTACQCTPVPI